MTWQYHLKNPEPDERVILIMRRHWFYFAAPALAIFGFMAVMIIFYSSANGYFPGLLSEPYLNAVLAINAFYFLFIWLYFFFIWIDYYLDVWIITNKRIIDIEQQGLFKREISEFKLYRIQDVTVSINGMIPTFLNFGNVHIQTAGETEKFIFKQVPDPYKAKDIILKLQNDAALSHPQTINQP